MGRSMWAMHASSCAEPGISRPGPDRTTVLALLRHAAPSLTAHAPSATRPPPPDPRRPPGRGRAGARGAARRRARARSSTWCCTARDGALRGPHATTAGSRSAAPTTAARTSGSSVDGRATRWPTSRPTSSRRSPTSAPTRYPHRAENAYPFAYEQIAQLFDHPAAPDLCVLHSAAHNWEDQGGHLGEHGSLGHRPGPGAVRDRRARACATLGLVPQSARLVDVAPTICALLGCAPATPTARYLAVPGRRRAPRRARRRASARATSSGSCSTAPTPTSSTTWPRAARRRTSPGSSRWAPRSGTARWRRCRRSRSPTTRRSSPARTPVTTASCNNAWFDRADRRAGHHQLVGDLAVEHAAPVRRASSRSTTPCTARGPTRSPRRSTSRATPAPTTRRSTSSAAARCRRSRRTRSACRTRPSGSCARRRTTRGRRSSTTWASTRRSASSAAATATSTYPMPRFMWCNFTLTDAAMHEGGPYSEIAAASVRDSDGRIGEILDGARAAPACSTTARSCSSPTTAWSRTTRRAAATGTSRCAAAGVEARDEALRLPLLRESRPQHRGRLVADLPQAQSARRRQAAGRVASRATRMIAIMSPGRRLPRPTSTSVPTIERTSCQQNALPRIS